MCFTPLAQTHCSCSRNDSKIHSPVALRISNPRQTYTAMVLHALYFVPQIRKAICNYLPMSTPAEVGEVLLGADYALEPPTSGPGQAMSLVAAVHHLMHTP